MPVGVRGRRRAAGVAGVRAPVPFEMRRSMAAVAADVPALPHVAVAECLADAAC
ncbi:Zinc finger, C3HC4 type (RING finger) [Musa troglodytarum]|uniref:Zinc finger, C3HC4 type (RING finger) n=1 Tax=Musa troglodytarum TaxID=320322 RepID=A0A9E7EZE8_9LILI|nr:Zinc finger, C3HC4 type (RING finger) [Musa troglodytarum]